MKSLIILYSYHHNNTEKIAKVFAEVLDAEIKTPIQINLEELKNYDLLGFGSGIDSAKHYKQILDLADTLPQAPNKKAFIFSTSAMISKSKIDKDHKKLRNKLQTKGYVIIDEFSCKGFNTNSFLRFVGGMNKGRPNSEDLNNAKEFAQNLKKNMNQ